MHSSKIIKKLTAPQEYGKTLYSQWNLYGYTQQQTYDEMESTYIQIHELGYRQMLEEMYIQWINLMNEKTDVYTNEKLKDLR